MSKPAPLNSTHHILSSIKRSRKLLGKMNETEKGLLEELLVIYSGDLRQLVDAASEGKAANRKAYLAPYVDLHNRVKKVYGKKGYRPAPALQMKWAMGSLQLLVGMMNNRHKYKQGELAPPASDEAILALQHLIEERTAPPESSIAWRDGNRGLTISAQLVDLFRICDGMTGTVRMHDGIQLLSVEGVTKVYGEFAERGIWSTVVPFGDEGTGNYYALSGGDVCDVNHEDNAIVPAYPGLAAFLAKAHKVSR